MHGVTGDIVEWRPVGGCSHRIGCNGVGNRIYSCRSAPGRRVRSGERVDEIGDGVEGHCHMCCVGRATVRSRPAVNANTIIYRTATRR
jgi:hypothetical protein